MAHAFTPLKNERFFEKVARAIQREILLGNLQPGQKLPNEAELGKQFNVGRSAIREALKVLEISGLLYVKRGYNGGTFVRPPDPADAFVTPTLLAPVATGWVQLMEARRLIEVKTASLAAERAVGEEILALGEEVERMRLVMATPARFIEQDFTFHLRIAEAAKNEVFVLVMDSIKTLLKKETNDLLLQAGTVDDIVSDHEAIYRRVAAHDSGGAALAMERHLQGLESRLALVSKD
jgi:GntR family transcriptional repressor for pyruvate dehydrogenase complex